jgi:hypothetical protein
MVSPVVFWIHFDAVIPCIPSSFCEFVRNLTLVIENLGSFTEKKITNFAEHSHESPLYLKIVTDSSFGGKERKNQG